MSALSDLELNVWIQVAAAAATGGATSDFNNQRVGIRAAEIADKVVLELRRRDKHGVSG